jgi:hypothetical protein
MVNLSKFAIAKLTTDPYRDERLNIAMVIFHDDRLDIRIARKLSKVKAISEAVDPTKVAESLMALNDLDATLRSNGIVDPLERSSLLNDLGIASLSGFGEIDSTTPVVYETMISLVMRDVVDAEVARPSSNRKSTKLVTLVRSALRREGILAKKGESLEAHRVVSNVHLAEGLVADFVLKNGAMHVVETVDASGDEISAKRVVTDIALSALTLEQARIVYGERATSGRLIYDASASAERLAEPSLRAAEHQGAELINWRSQDDQRKFIDQLVELAEPSEYPKGAPTRFVSGFQRRLNFN